MHLTVLHVSLCRYNNVFVPKSAQKTRGSFIYYLYSYGCKHKNIGKKGPESISVRTIDASAVTTFSFFPSFFCLSSFREYFNIPFYRGNPDPDTLISRKWSVAFTYTNTHVHLGLRMLFCFRCFLFCFKQSCAEKSHLNSRSLLAVLKISYQRVPLLRYLPPTKSFGKTIYFA